jgi:hypothetical protein
VRATLALVGSLVLMFVIGFGISMDVEDLRYAVLDRDQSTLSQNYTLNLRARATSSSSRHRDYEDLDRRMRSGELSLAIEIPPGFGRDVLRGSRCSGRLVRRRHAPARRDRQRLCRACTSSGWRAGARAHGASWAARSASKRAFATTPM